MVALENQRLRGWVRSFRGNWGFLNSDLFEGDLFVGLKGNPHLAGLNQDDEVEFEVRGGGDRGRAEAVHVAVIGRVRSASSRGSEQAGEAQVFQGWVRSFSGQWGFLNSAELSGDVFIGLRSNPQLPALAQGDEVEFETRTDDRGKTEAVSVRLLTPVAPAAQVPVPVASPDPAPQAVGPAERASVGHLVGQVLEGRIKSFRDFWGFINSDSFAGDLFIHLRSNADLGPVSPGNPVRFEVAQDPNAAGGFHAINAQLVRCSPLELAGQRLHGWVKSFKENWGLINSNRFDGDVFVGLKSNPQLASIRLQQGSSVEFQIERDDKSKNGVQAVHVKPVTLASPMFLASGPVPLPSAPAGFGGCFPGQRLRPQELLGRRCFGVIRSFKDGWGFVISDEFEGDLFLHEGSNPGIGSLHPGDAVSFDVATSPSGKCQAKAVQPMMCELAQLVGRVCTGQVRSFKETHGFVTSAKYAGDLFVGMRSNSHLVEPLKVGDQIEFTVQQTTTGRSQTGFEATSVRVLGTPAGMPHITQVPPGGMSRAEFRSRSPPIVKGAVGVNLASPHRLDAASLADPATKAGEVHEGRIRSFRSTWGFVNAATFSGDLFIGTRSNPHLPRELVAEDRVRFRIAIGTGGKPEAVEVQLL